RCPSPSSPRKRRKPRPAAGPGWPRAPGKPSSGGYGTMKLKQFSLALLAALLLAALTVPALAAPEGDAGTQETAQTQSVQEEDDSLGLKAVAMGLAVGLAAGGGG